MYGKPQLVEIWMALAHLTSLQPHSRQPQPRRVIDPCDIGCKRSHAAYDDHAMFEHTVRASGLPKFCHRYVVWGLGRMHGHMICEVVAEWVAGRGFAGGIDS